MLLVTWTLSTVYPIVPVVAVPNVNVMLPTCCTPEMPVQGAPNQVPVPTLKSWPVKVFPPVELTFEATYQRGVLSGPKTKSVTKSVLCCWITFTPQPDCDSAGALYQRSVKSMVWDAAAAGRARAVAAAARKHWSCRFIVVSGRRKGVPRSHG